MALPTTAIVGAVMMIVSTPDQLPTLEQNTKNEIHEAEGHRADTCRSERGGRGQRCR